ncbi:MAG: 3'-5' exonuclease [Candidatus Thiodiazotropha sp.]
MDVSPILDPLNDAQREAVSAPVGHLLVLAGAGSGKTRVLVHRIAWLLAVESASPWSVLAVTFTNKAAREMRNRIETLLGQPLGGMWVGTFHGLAHRLLRAHWKEAGLAQAFQILDADDQFRQVKRLLKSLDLDEARWPPRQVQWFINGKKDEGLRPEHLDDGGDPYQRFQHLLVDEFQDTNAIQYAWLRLLCGSRNNLFVVGDDDQSIYGWRGARVENIQSLQSHYPSTTLVRLEQNYRSTGNILNAANALINHNASRLGKQLWTADGEGEPINLYAAFNEIDEARFEVERIRRYIEEGHVRTDVAILYRTTAQSRLFEEALIQAAIPYRVYGGLRFFERAEIKDALAYLRLLSNRHDDGAFERAVNTPPRGIGAKTLDSVRAHARDFDCSLWQATEALLRGGGMPKRAASALRGFLDLMEEMEVETRDQELSAKVAQLLDLSRLPHHFEKSRDGKGVDRKENLEELVNACRQFRFEQGSDTEMDELSAFLSHAALEAGDTQGDPYEECVQLMTLHSAKGLEFPLVFLVGMEEGLFPHSMSSDDPARLEEERRLCYVGMTRAMRLLYLSHAESRRLHGSDSYPLPSRFIREIPAELMREVRGGPAISQPLYGGAPYLETREMTGFSLGQRVRHAKFGEGVVLNAEGQGRGARVQVNFEEVGSKWLVVAYANLSPL